jgi:NAD-dependent deacetylase
VAWQEAIESAIHLLRSSRHTVALTGAGISTPSGIPDFRSPDSGLWSGVDPFQVASIYAFRHRPQDFYDWIHPLAKVTVTARPNPAHEALVSLEANGPLRSVITQNIDMLHTRAGSRVVHEVHGHLRELTCLRCYGIYSSAGILDSFIENRQVPLCPDCGGVLKPNVILFGEQLPVRVLSQARKDALACDVMLVIGTSLEVAPAGDLPLMAKNNGARIIIVNRDDTCADEFADVVFHADVVEILPRLSAAFSAPIPPGFP